MNLPLYIAKRYLLSKKSHQVINVISGVSIAGVALATLAMVCTLSVFNGFGKLVEIQSTAFNPDIRISATQGKVFTADTTMLERLREIPQVSVVTQCIEEKAMVQYGGRQVMVTLKGVEANYTQQTNIKDVLIGNGSTILADSIANYAIPGAGLVTTLNSGISFVRPYEIFTPRRGKKVSLTNPAANFNKDYLQASGYIFVVNQAEYDDNYILTSIDFTRKLFTRGASQVSSLELHLLPHSDLKATKNAITKILGEGYEVKDRREQQEDIFRIMEIEKFISYIFLTFILLVACFNIIGSLSMLILEKRKDVSTLRSLGANDRLIVNIFVSEGILISSIGAIIGILTGVAVCLAQEHWGLLALGSSGDNLIVDSYPVDVHFTDILLVFGTVVAVGLIAVAIPVKILTKKILNGGYKY